MTTSVFMRILTRAIDKSKDGAGRRVMFKNMMGEMKVVDGITYVTMDAFQPGKGRVGLTKVPNITIKGGGIGFTILPWEEDNWELRDSVHDGEDVLLLARVQKARVTERVEDEPLLYSIVSGRLLSGKPVMLDFMVYPFMTPDRSDVAHLHGTVKSIDIVLGTGFSSTDPDAKFHRLVKMTFYEKGFPETTHSKDTLSIYASFFDNIMDVRHQPEWTLVNHDSN